MWLPPDQWMALTALTATREKSSNTSQYFSGYCCTVTTPPANHMHLFPRQCCCSSPLNAKESGSQGCATKQLYLSPLWRLRGQNAGSSFFYPSLFAVFTPDGGWSLSSLRSLDSSRRNWLRSPSSLRPVDSRVAAGQPIMKWPWSSDSGAVALLKQ